MLWLPGGIRAEAPGIGSANKDTWKKIGNKWYMFDGARMLTGFQEDEGYTYYLGDNGVMRTGWQKVGGDWYYLDGKGHTVDGIKTINGKTYIFDKGLMKTGLITYDGDYYYLGDDGVMKKDYLLYTDPEDVLDSYFMFQYSYYVKSGYKVFMYFGSDGKSELGWHKIDGNWYYLYKSSSGFPLPIRGTGYETIGDDVYMFSEDGVMLTGWVSSAQYGDTDPYLVYCNTNGKAARGWTKIDGKWYFFETDSESKPVMRTGIIEITKNGKTNSYYLNDKGVLQTGWINTGADYLYSDSNGVLQSSWQTIGGKLYYFNEGFKMVTGFYTIDNKLYYFDSNGICKNYESPFVIPSGW